MKPDERKVVGWMAYCPETGGRCLEYTKENAQWIGQICYEPRPFVVVPLYAGTNDEGAA